MANILVRFNQAVDRAMAWANTRARHMSWDAAEGGFWFKEASNEFDENGTPKFLPGITGNGLARLVAWPAHGCAPFTPVRIAADGTLHKASASAQATLATHIVVEVPNVDEVLIAAFGAWAGWETAGRWYLGTTAGTMVEESSPEFAALVFRQLLLTSDGTRGHISLDILGQPAQAAGVTGDLQLNNFGSLGASPYKYSHYVSGSQSAHVLTLTAPNDSYVFEMVRHSYLGAALLQFVITRIGGFQIGDSKNLFTRRRFFASGPGGTISDELFMALGGIRLGNPTNPNTGGYNITTDGAFGYGNIGGYGSLWLRHGGAWVDLLAEPTDTGNVRVSGADTTPRPLGQKIVAGAGLTSEIVDPGDDETLRFASQGILRADAADIDAAEWGALLDKMLAGDNVSISAVVDGGIRKVRVDAVGGESFDGRVQVKYLDIANGDDANNGETPLSAYKTTKKIMDELKTQTSWPKVLRVIGPNGPVVFDGSQWAGNNQVPGNLTIEVESPGISCTWENCNFSSSPYLFRGGRLVFKNSTLTSSVIAQVYGVTIEAGVVAQYGTFIFHVVETFRVLAAASASFTTQFCGIDIRARAVELENGLNTVRQWLAPGSTTIRIKSEDLTVYDYAMEWNANLSLEIGAFGGGGPVYCPSLTANHNLDIRIGRIQQASGTPWLVLGADTGISPRLSGWVGTLATPTPAGVDGIVQGNPNGTPINILKFLDKDFFAIRQSSTDDRPGYLHQKLRGDGVTVQAVNVADPAPGPGDYTEIRTTGVVKTDAGDIDRDEWRPLASKLVAGTNIALDVVVDGGIRKVRIAASGGGNAFDFLDMAPQAVPPTYAEGNVYWDADKKTLVGQRGVGDVNFEYGRELLLWCQNSGATAIAGGEAVYIAGANGGGLLTVQKAIANAKQTSALIGIATMDIPAGEPGEICFFGEVSNVDTSAFSVGDLLYVSDTVAGGYTTTPPHYPSYEARIGRVVVSNATTGRILCLPDTDPNIGAIPGGVVFRESTMSAPAMAVGGKGGFSNADGWQFGTSFYASAQWKPTRARYRNGQGTYSQMVRVALYNEAGTRLAQTERLTAANDSVISGTFVSSLAVDLVPGNLYHAVICSKNNGMKVYGTSPGALNDNPRWGFEGQIVMPDLGGGNFDAPADISSILGSATIDRAWVEFF